jgi:hypothetical protein
VIRVKAGRNQGIYSKFPDEHRPLCPSYILFFQVIFAVASGGDDDIIAFRFLAEHTRPEDPTGSEG